MSSVETQESCRAGVIGWPIAHSRSPLIHRYWLSKYGIDGSYDPYSVPADDVGGFFEEMRQSGLAGCNVTLPHKEAAFHACDWRDEAATALGAVNTVWLEGDRLCGGNTDAYGFLANLDRQAPGWDENAGPALVLGAGGASRAIVWALLQRGFGPVRIVNRTRRKADDLRDFFGSATAAHEWADRDALCRDARILVNTTSLGMDGHPPLEIDLSALPAGALVTDIVYVPLDTALLISARALGLRAVDGLGMLLHQAVPGFEKWFGVRPEVTAELREIVVKNIVESA